MRVVAPGGSLRINAYLLTGSARDAVGQLIESCRSANVMIWAYPAYHGAMSERSPEECDRLHAASRGRPFALPARKGARPHLNRRPGAVGQHGWLRHESFLLRAAEISSVAAHAPADASSSARRLRSKRSSWKRLVSSRITATMPVSSFCGECSNATVKAIDSARPSL